VCRHLNCSVRVYEKHSNGIRVEDGQIFNEFDNEDYQETGEVEVECDDCGNHYRFTNEKHYPLWLKNIILGAEKEAYKPTFGDLYD
jgi:hypothetical protein